MEAIVSRSAGIDIGKAVLKATVRVQGDQQHGALAGQVQQRWSSTHSAAWT